MQAVAKDGKLVITVPLTPKEQAPLSSTGKNKVLFSSGGFKEAGGVRISLNIIPAKD